MSDIMKVGYYDAFIKNFGLAKHAFCCIEKEDGTTQWFDCAGGHTSTTGRVFPAKMYKKYNWLRPSNITQCKANLSWSKAIAGWSSRDETVIQKSRSGLIYGLTGVCHQMANSVLFPCKPNGNYTYGYIHPAMVLSAIQTWKAYGYYGGGPAGVFDKARMKAFNKKRTPSEQLTEEEITIYETELVQQRLDFKFDKFVILDLLHSNFGLDKTDSKSEDILIELEKNWKDRNDLEKELLLGNFNNSIDAANASNQLFQEDQGLLNSILLEYLVKDDNFEPLAPSTEEIQIINPNFLDLDKIGRIGKKVNF